MSKKSKESAKASEDRRRPFAVKLLREARKLAEQYQVVVHLEDGHWYGRGVELPLVFGNGKTPEACIKDTREALVLGVATMLECGERPPVPAIAGQRTMQVNVRMTAEEKLLLGASAKRQGYDGLSDFIRAVVVEAAR